MKKDMFGRELKVGDYVIWGSKRQGYDMKLAKVLKIGETQVHIDVYNQLFNKRRCLPENLMVVNEQLAANNEIEGMQSLEDYIKEVKDWDNVNV